MGQKIYVGVVRRKLISSCNFPAFTSLVNDENGITAFQLDIKVEGINKEIMKAALLQAREGRIHILKKMLEACPESKKDLSKYAPRIETMQIPPSKIALVIGPGGKQTERSSNKQVSTSTSMMMESLASPLQMEKRWLKPKTWSTILLQM